MPAFVLGSVRSPESTNQDGEGTEWELCLPKRECFDGREIAVRACESSLVDARTSTPHVLMAVTSTCCKLFMMVAEYCYTRLSGHWYGVCGW